MANGNGVTVNTKIDINTVIQVIGMIIVGIVFIVTINNKLDNLDAKIEDHKVSREIHMSVSESEQYFVRRSELDAIKEQLDRIERKVNGK